MLGWKGAAERYRVQFGSEPSAHGTFFPAQLSTPAFMPSHTFPAPFPDHIERQPFALMVFTSTTLH